MITYDRSAFGLNLLFRVHGSAVYRSVFPSFFSVAIYFLIHYRYSANLPIIEQQDLGHPYAIGVLVGSVTFLIVFRASQGYARYWEGAGAVHQMMSKWMDATIHSCVYHLQCKHYDDIKPPSYFDYQELNHLFLTRDRERGEDYYNQEPDSERTNSHRYMISTNTQGANTFPENQNEPAGDRGFVRQISTKIQASYSKKQSHKKGLQAKRKQQLRRSRVKSINTLGSTSRSLPADSSTEMGADGSDIQFRGGHRSLPDIRESIQSSDFTRIDPNAGFRSSFVTQFLDDSERKYGDDPTPLVGKPRMDGNWSSLYKTKQIFFSEDDPKGFASIAGGRTPPLFLQELAHLSSLLVAVAFSTLRNDLEGHESPLSFYEPGKPWPEVDPDQDELLKMRGYKSIRYTIMMFFGMGRSQEEQTKYNAARPFPVIGGVSDAEIKFLQMARGPYAKTMLCWNWLSEFIIREHLAGTLGKVGPPIVSRVIQFLGDGMIYYNHARKIMFIPFPFPHSQLSVMFIVVLIPCIPFMMDQYVDEVWLGAILTFFTILCLSGIHEVARDLENPFRNVPNEIPLVTLLAQYNEALITMYSGWHPDHFWDGKRILRQHQRHTGQDVRDTYKKVHPKAYATPSPAPPPSSSASDQSAEIAELKRQLKEQSKMIKELAEMVYFDPKKETDRMERETSFHPRYSAQRDAPSIPPPAPYSLSPSLSDDFVESVREEDEEDDSNSMAKVVTILRPIPAKPQTPQRRNESFVSSLGNSVVGIEEENVEAVQKEDEVDLSK